MRKGHFRETQRVIRSLKHIISKADGASDHKHQMALSLNSQLFDLSGKGYRVQHMTVDFQCDHIGVVPDVF